MGRKDRQIAKDFGLHDPVSLGNRIPRPADDYREDRDLLRNGQLKSPGLKRVHFLGLAARPFREKKHRHPRPEIFDRFTVNIPDASVVPALQTDMFAKPQAPAEEWNSEKTFLRHPFELQAELVQNHDIRQTLVVGHDHIGAFRIRILEAVHFYFPVRAQTDHGTGPPETLPVQDLPLFIKGKANDQKDQLDEVKKRDERDTTDPEKDRKQSVQHRYP